MYSCQPNTVRGFKQWTCSTTGAN